ncbi:MAG: 50S ribosomal protein L1 [bacterium]
MRRRGKRYLLLKKKIDRNKLYSPGDALRLVKETSNCKFEESVEAAICLNIKPKAKGERVRGTVVLPQGVGKNIKIAVFAEGDEVELAKEAGADYVDGEELAKRIEGGWLEFDAVVSTPRMMRLVAKLGRILGPKGLMPSPKVGTVSEDPARVVEELKRGKIEYKSDATGVIHAPLGRISFNEEALLDNLKALLKSLIKDKPSTVKGRYIKGISLCSTMGPGIGINVQKALEIL